MMKIVMTEANTLVEPEGSVPLNTKAIGQVPGLSTSHPQNLFPQDPS
jgi:hypothetical protein